MGNLFGFVERQSEFAFCGAAISVAALFLHRKNGNMITNCKNLSKIAAKISPQETENIKNRFKSAVKDFCDRYYDQIYYDRWFTIKTVFSDDYYKQEPFKAVYDYYFNIGKNEKDAEIFAVLDLNCLFEEVLANEVGVYTKDECGKNPCLSSYILIRF